MQQCVGDLKNQNSQLEESWWGDSTSYHMVVPYNQYDRRLCTCFSTVHWILQMWVFYEFPHSLSKQSYRGYHMYQLKKQ